MKKILTAVITMLTLSISAVASLPVVAHAAYKCGGVDTTIDFTMNGTFTQLCDASGASPATAILLWAISIMSIGVGIAVVIGIIFGGITYAMSDGDAGKAKEGQEIIVNSVIGLFLFIFLYAGANFLIPGGLFTK